MHRAAAASLLGPLTIAALACGCAGEKPASAQPSVSSAAAAADGDIPKVLATIGDEKITMSDVRTRVGDDLSQMEIRYQRARHKTVETALEQILRDRVLMAEATKQGKTVDQLIEAEAGGSLEPSDIEIAAWYKDNKSRIGGRALDQIRPQVADFLRKERRDQASEKLNARLNADRKVTINLKPFSVPLNNDGAPAMGPADARVTLVEFSDFQCPYCGRFFPTLKKIEQDFGDSVRIVYRQYPLTNLHPNAFKAAEASLCAQDQGKFWEYHDVLFQEQDRLGVKDLKLKADRLGLEQKKFDKCLDSGRHTEQVQADMSEGSGVGVTGTPALFVNGVSIEGGAVAYEVVAKALNKEMARTRQ
jgi:protein-disulfide isomerase